MSDFWKDYKEINEELAEVRAIVKKSVNTSEKYFKESIYSMVDAGGKMLRPAFLLISGKVGNYDSEKMHNLAAVLEILHLATLIHDDIIDESNLRRGVETVQSKYGKEYAIYAGDYMFCNCFMMLSKYDYNTENLREISKAISKICLGEIKQYNLRYSQKISILKYIKIVSGKTAALFAISLYVGANEAGCDEKLAKIFGRIGYNIGMAFQIMDDILDYSSNSVEMGKGTQRDLVRGYYTLPLIFALEKDHKGELSYLLNESTLSEEDVKKVIEIVKNSDGLERSKVLAKKYTDRAFKNIEKLPSSNSKTILTEVTTKLLDRKY